MKKQELKKFISSAEKICSHSGAHLSESRKRILELLVCSKAPRSAYEVTYAYNRTSETRLPTMSVYRTLDFLENKMLVQKLRFTNKYVACAHIACDRAYEVPQFLIYNDSQPVKEIAISKSIIGELDKQVVNAGYTFMNSQLEWQCVVEHCLENAA